MVLGSGRDSDAWLKKAGEAESSDAHIFIDAPAVLQGALP